MPPLTVGVIANPASGRDIRRLVTGGSVFDNAEKASMVFRLLVGLGAAGVERVLMMPAADGLGAGVARRYRNRGQVLSGSRCPELQILDWVPTGTEEDTLRAVGAMCDAGVAAIAVLGGDGTHRLVARECGDVPLCALSTGTNNTFPEMREATVAGLAMGLLATERVDPSDTTVVRERSLGVSVTGSERADLALVDVAAVASHFVGARALWKPDDVSELVVAFANPSAVGLSAVAGQLEPTRRGEEGVYVRFASLEEAAIVVDVPLAPGFVTRMGIREHRRLSLGDVVVLSPGTGTIALDGERTFARSLDDRVSVRLATGPLRIDVDAVMAAAGRQRALPTYLPSTLMKELI
jgi:predicted polyphosphate/ATP-dependent NAD kinase